MDKTNAVEPTHEEEARPNGVRNSDVMHAVQSDHLFLADELSNPSGSPDSLNKGTDKTHSKLDPLADDIFVKGTTEEEEGEVYESHENATNHRTPSVLFSLFRSGRQVIRRAKAMPPRHLLFVISLVVSVMVGNFLQILMLNFWLVSFPGETPGNYTSFAIPAILLNLFFVILFSVYAVIRKPDLKFARHAKGWFLIFGIGFMDMLNSWMATYAASYTSEVLQALFTNLCPLYAVFFSKYFLKDTRTYTNVYIIAVFVLTILGILAACLYGFITNAEHMGDGKWWILIFFASMPFRVLMNVWQSLYMILYTYDDNFIHWLRVRFDRGDVATAGSSAVGESGEGPAVTVEPTTDRRSLPARRSPMHAAEKKDSVVDAVVNETTPEHRGRPKRRTREVSSGHRSISSSDLDDSDERLQREDSDELGPTLVLPPRGRSTPPPAGTANNSLFTSFAEARDPPVYTSHFSSMHPTPILHFNSILSSPRDPTPMLIGGEVEEDTPGAAEEVVSIRYHQGDDTAVKLFMLATETTIQVMCTIAMLPADALPWWGNSESVHDTWDNFTDGVVCMFTIPKNFAFGFLYTLGFVLTYTGCAYLNHYSVALCSIVTQLSSPLTAFMLVIVPSWNVAGDSGGAPWYCSIIAIVLLIIAAFLYVIWEELTDAEKVESERVLKMVELKVKPLGKERH